MSAEPSGLPEPQHPLPRAAVTYWRAQSIGAAVAIGVVAMAVLGVLWGLIALAVGVAVGVVGPEVLWRRWRYEVRAEELDLRHGLLTVKRTLVPIRRVQHVDTSSGALQGMFDLASVSVHTAAGETEIPALTRGEAEAVRRRIGELARTRDDT